MKLTRSVLCVPLLLTATAARADFVSTLDTTNIADFQVEKCELRASRKTMPEPGLGGLFKPPGPSSDLKVSKLEWDEKTKTAEGSVDDEAFLVTVKKLEKIQLPQATKDTQKYLTDLRKVDFLSVEVTDGDGEAVQLYDFDHTKVKKVRLSIGNYNGVFFDLAASNQSSRNMVVIHDVVEPKEQKTFTTITVHCPVKVVPR